MKTVSLALLVLCSFCTGIARAQDVDIVDTYRHAATILPNDGADDYDRERCINRFKESNLDKKTIEKLISLRELRKTVPGLRNRGVNCPYLEEWTTLVYLGVRLEVLSELDEEHLIGIVRDIKTNRTPGDVMALMATENEMYAYPQKFALSLTTSYDKAMLKQRLGKHKHLYRTSTDYKEDPSQIDRITDEVMIKLVGAWLDYAESPESKRTISSLFPEKPGENPEWGGVALAGNKVLYIVPVGPCASMTLEAKNAWVPPLIMYYMNNIGSIHTHPLDAASDHPAELSGPTGYSKSYEGYVAHTGDFYMNSYYALANPYRMDAVATEISKDKWNLDIYFRDVRKDAGGELENFGDTIVIDLGIFSVKP